MKHTLAWLLREGLYINTIYNCWVELPNPEVCDATAGDSNTEAGSIIFSLHKKTGTIAPVSLLKLFRFS